MLKYKSNESKTSSHFFITTDAESIHLLNFSTIEEETMLFDNDYLQENVVEMQIARVSGEREIFCKSLSNTIKTIFDNLLYKYDDFIVYTSVPVDSLKEKLIHRYIIEDDNDEFFVFRISIYDYTMFFFLNTYKTNLAEAMNGIVEFFKSEYDVDLKLNIK
ncbi:MAG: hypothetical protein AAF611_08280 [Bacteroidota bacterium]